MTRLTLLGGPCDGETREVPDDYGTEGVYVPLAGRTHIYIFKGEVKCINGEVRRYAEFSETLSVFIPDFQQ
jgi:hypothetical protein